MKDLPLNTLRAFAAVYETGGIRPAGRRLGVTHSSISRHLKELEAWIATPLFERTVKGGAIKFTPQGEALGQSVLSSMGELNAAVTAIREAKHANSVTISTTPSFAVRWLLPRLPLFENDHPNIELSVIVDQQLKAPGEEEADVTIRMGQGPWENENCQPLMDDELYPVMSPAYWESSGRPNSLAELRLLHDRDPNTHWSKWKQTHGPANMDTRKGSRLSSSDLVLRAAEQGMGVALARHCLAADSLKIGRLIRPFGEKNIPLVSAYWLITTPQAQQRRTVQIVVEWLNLQAKTNS